LIPKRLVDEIERWLSEKRYGSIQINFSGGKIINYNITQSLKVDMIIVNHPDTKVSIESLETKNILS